MRSKASQRSSGRNSAAVKISPPAGGLARPDATRWPRNRVDVSLMIDEIAKQTVVPVSAAASQGLTRGAHRVARGAGDMWPGVDRTPGKGGTA